MEKTLRKIIHIDMDYFYAQVEIRDNPKLKGKVVIISGPPESRSVVTTCSYEARKLGIHAGMPSYKAFKLCNEAIFIPPNFEKYRLAHEQMMAIFHKYSDIIEPLSLDEAYIDVTFNKKGVRSATHVAQMIQNEILLELQLTCSIGVSYNKLIAKLASDYKKPYGITVVVPEKADLFLNNLKIKDFPGVGKKSIHKFVSLGILTGEDFKALSKDKAEKLFGKLGIGLYDYVRGIDNREIVMYRDPKSVGYERTFDHDLVDHASIKAQLDKIIVQSHRRLAKYDYAFKTISLKVKYNDFTVESKSKTIVDETYRLLDIIPLAYELLKRLNHQKRDIRLIGITYSNLCDVSEVKDFIRFQQIPLNIDYK